MTHYTEPKRVESWASAANAKIRLGKISRRMTEAGVNIEVLYSDHYHQLILVVDDVARARAVSEAWTREQAQPDRQKHHERDAKHEEQE